VPSNITLKPTNTSSFKNSSPLHLKFVINNTLFKGIPASLLMDKVPKVFILKNLSSTIICDILFSEEKFIFQPQYKGVNKHDFSMLFGGR
jgi:hypothetical protein